MKCSDIVNKFANCSEMRKQITFCTFLHTIAQCSFLLCSSIKHSAKVIRKKVKAKRQTKTNFFLHKC